MSLAQDIVFKSEFTVKGARGRGSRGSTPGDYVLRYMARDGAVEDLAPVVVGSRLDDYVTKYMARDSAVKRVQDARVMGAELERDKGFSGVAFGNDASGKFSPTLMDSEVRADAQKIQAGFDSGRPVIKLVMSFTDEYLKKCGIVPEDTEVRGKAPYRGKVDELKLRSAIGAAMAETSTWFSDLTWIGCVQVDTHHVHAHIAACDLGDNPPLTKDGQVRGTIPLKVMNKMRLGLDEELRELTPMKQLSSQIGQDRQNIRAYVRGQAWKEMRREGVPQYLMAVLPKDTRLWQARSHAPEMRAANEACEQYVRDVWRRDKSGIDAFEVEVKRYALERSIRLGEGDAGYKRYYNRGMDRLMRDSMNAVYSVIRDLPERARTVVKTPMMDAMSADVRSEVQAGDPLDEFCLKLSSYGSRARHHAQERDKWVKRKHDFDRQKELPGTDKAGVEALSRFAEEEVLYNDALVGKYRHFLNFDWGMQAYERERLELERSLRELHQAEQMIAEAAASHMNYTQAEMWGRKTYGLAGAGLATVSPVQGQFVVDRFRQRAQRQQERLSQEATDSGYVVKVDGESVRLVRGEKYDFNQVKALDLHHLGYDFGKDVRVSENNVRRFCLMSQMRVEAFVGAADFMRATGQESMISSILGAIDIRAMQDTAKKVAQAYGLENKRMDAGKRHDGSTYSLDEHLDRAVEQSTQDAIARLKEQIAQETQIEQTRALEL